MVLPRSIFLRFLKTAISSHLQSFINESNTGIAYRSDHSPVYLTFQFTEYESGKGTWKFNNRLLLDEEYIKIIITDELPKLSILSCRFVKN
jgi:hypothetical protein